MPYYYFLLLVSLNPYSLNRPIPIRTLPRLG